MVEPQETEGSLEEGWARGCLSEGLLLYGRLQLANGMAFLEEAQRNMVRQEVDHFGDSASIRMEESVNV